MPKSVLGMLNTFKNASPPIVGVVGRESFGSLVLVLEERERKKMEKIFAVYRDGFQLCDFGTLDDARACLSHYKRGSGYYQLCIYRKNDDGKLVWVE